MQRLDHLVNRISLALAVLAGTALVAIAVIIMLEVTMRALSIPLIGASEVVRVTFVASVYLAFAHVITQDREIRVDVLRGFFPAQVERLIEALASLVTLAFFAMIFWFSVERLQDNWARGVYLEGRLLIPMWVPWGTIMIGTLMSVVAAALAVMRKLAHRV